MHASSKILKSKSFTSLVGNGIGAVLGVVTFGLLARFLGKVSFGPWLLFLAIYGVFDTLRLGMVLNALVRNLAQAHDETDEKRVIGSSLFITLAITLGYVVLVAIVYLLSLWLGLFREYVNFLPWLAITAIITAPHNFATWLLNAKLHILSMSAIRILIQIIFIIFIVLVVKDNVQLDNVFVGYAIANGAVSLLCIFLGWSGFQHLLSYSRTTLNKIFHFGKYSMGTLIGSNLLRSSDSFIISSMLGTAPVAIYNVPARLIEIIEMPLRSFSLTTLPAWAKLNANEEFVELRNKVERRTGLVFYLLLPISVLSFIFAEQVVYLLGGAGYEDSVILLRLFVTYMAILPLDKFTGVLLDTINLPNLNFLKVCIMLAVNVVGDILGIWVFGSLESVAIVSTLTFMAGVFFGYKMVQKKLDISLLRVFTSGFQEWLYWFNLIIKRNGYKTV